MIARIIIIYVNNQLKCSNCAEIQSDDVQSIHLASEVGQILFKEGEAANQHDNTHPQNVSTKSASDRFVRFIIVII